MNSYSDTPEVSRGYRVSVLDHGYVEWVDFGGDDLAPLESARMSTKNPTGVDIVKDDRLRNRLWHDQHTSVFEAIDMTVEIQCPVFVLRQVDRHRTLHYGADHDVIDDVTVDDVVRRFMSRNEFSGRYSVMDDLCYVPSLDRMRGKGNAANLQGSGDPLPPATQVRAQEVMQNTQRAMWNGYSELLALGLANETARIILPFNQYTRLRLKGAGLSWLRFLDLRLRYDVQWETRQYAKEIARLFRSRFPRTWAVFEEHSLYGLRFSRSELQTIQRFLSTDSSGIGLRIAAALSTDYLADET